MNKKGIKKGKLQLRITRIVLFPVLVAFFLIFIVNPQQAVVFLIIFFVLQQIEGNLIYPHVVGNSVGLPSIWVLLAVIAGGKLMGIVGMFLFIPLASVCYTLFRQLVYDRLKEKIGKQSKDENRPGQ